MIGGLVITRSSPHVEDDVASAVAKRLPGFRVPNYANGRAGCVAVLKWTIKDNRSKSGDLCVLEYAKPIVDTNPIANAMVVGVGEMNDGLSTRDSLRGGGPQDMDRRVRSDLVRMSASNNAVPPLSKRLELDLIFQLRTT